VLSAEAPTEEDPTEDLAARETRAIEGGRVAQIGIPSLNHLVPDGMRIIRWGAGFVRGGSDLEADRLRAVASAYEDEDDLPDLILWMTPEETRTVGFSPPPGSVECLVRVSWGPDREA